ncbi:MAG: S1C family serine protease [Candidatus Dormibacteria bacterium]
MGLAEELEAAAAAVRERALNGVVGVGGTGSWGSGLVLQAGVVVTSAHNVRSDQPLVHFMDGSRRAATHHELDLGSDLAVLEVDTAEAPPLSWAGQGPELGTPVFAAANPGGHGPRLSFGVVSGLDRSFRGPQGRPITGGFEHTAPLPHGSSGGPVLSLGGELLGINTKRLGEGLYAALGADPDLRGRIDLLARGERPERAYLGVGLLPGEVARRLRAAVGLADQEGLLVRHLDPEGPAAKAGLLRGDLLTAAGGTALRQPGHIHRILATRKPGDQLAVDVIRGADQLQVTVELGREPEGQDPRSARHHHFHHRR